MLTGFGCETFYLENNDNKQIETAYHSFDEIFWLHLDIFPFASLFMCFRGVCVKFAKLMHTDKSSRLLRRSTHMNVICNEMLLFSLYELTLWYNESSWIIKFTRWFFKTNIVGCFDSKQFWIIFTKMANAFWFNIGIGCKWMTGYVETTGWIGIHITLNNIRYYYVCTMHKE